MEYRKSPHNIDPAVVMRSIFRRPQTWAVLLLILFAPILAGSILASTQNQEMLNNTTATLRETSERQRDFAVSTLDSIALIMNESTSNIHYIDVGRTEAKDDEVDAALACQVLRQNTEPYPNINSAYLICNLNHTIYNSLDKVGYADDEFYDLSWRLQYHASRGGMQLLDDIRTVRTPYRQEDTYISMVSRVPYLSTLQNKWLVYNISINDLGNRLITEAEASRDANYSNTLWIYNSKGNLIWSQQDGDIPETYDELLSRQDTSVTVTDGVLISTKEGRYLTATTEDATYGWRYVQTLPYANVLNKTHNTNRRLWAGMIIVVVILLFIWFNTIYTQNASELQAAENIRLKTNIPPEEAEDCLPYLARVSTQEQARAAANDQVLHSFRDVLQEHIVLSLIGGEPVHGEKATARRELMAQMGLLQDQPQKYTVMLARIEAISALKLNMHQDIYGQFRKILQYGCSERLLEGYRAYYAWADHSLLAAIFCIPAEFNARQVQLGLDQMGTAIQKQLTLLSEQPVVIAFGSVMDVPWDLAESCGHAKQLIQHKVYYNKDTPYTYSEKMEIDMQMSYDHQKKLVDQIKLGKVKDASELLESYFSMLHDNPYLQLDRAREIGAQLTDTIHSAIIGKEKELDDRYSDVKQLKAEIHSLESVHDVADCVVSYAQAAARVMYDQLQNKKDIRVQEILEWIGNNYNQDIALDDVAEQMGLSATYASKQIKAYTGTNVVNYINNLRIEHAKELLETTKMSSNEIGAYVGFRYSQSFIRSFRKIVGMTPGNYRSLHKKDGKVEAEALKSAQQEKETTE